MDSRRHLMPGAVALALAGCAHLQALGLTGPARPSLRLAETVSPVTPPANADAAPVTAAPAGELGAPPRPIVATTPAIPEPKAFAAMAPIPNPGPRSRRGAFAGPPSARPEIPPAQNGRPAIAAANATARETSQAHGFLGGVQVFVYDPGRVYEVWTAPLRVTTLTLSRGETVISKAAGDTVRWQIGETTSGEGAQQRAHVMIKPLARGLETNLVLATNRRVYLIQLRSGDVTAFNTAITWDLQSLMVAAGPEAPVAAEAPASSPVALVEPQGPLDARFRIKPKGRRPAWTPSAVATDGVRTFLRFPPGVTAGEAPALFALSPSGDPQLVNYRQQGDLWVVDRVLSAGELRVGGRHAEVVEFKWLGAAS